MSKSSKSDLIATLTDLVGFQTQTGDGTGCGSCFDYIEALLGDSAMQLNRYKSEEFTSLVATTKNTQQPKVLLQAHLDVVPAPDSLFKLTEKDGKLYGRGVYDMKFAAACYLQLVEDLKEDLTDYNFGIMFTSDEEVGGKNGVGMLLDKGYGAEICLLPDGGDDWNIESSCNGVWMVKLTASGKTTHGSRPWEGVNAIDNLIQALEAIKQVFGRPDPAKSSMTVSQITGGQALNQVPGKAEATLDMRFIDEADYKTKHQAVEAIAEKQGLDLKTLAHVDCCVTDCDDPSIASFIKVAERIHGQSIGKTRSFGSSDAHFFAAKGIPTIVIRPTGGGAHSDDEWIDKAELRQFYEVIKAFVMETAKLN